MANIKFLPSSFYHLYEMKAKLSFYYSDNSPSCKRKATDSNLGTNLPFFTKPKLPPFLAEPGSSEYKEAKNEKSSPF